MSSYEIHHKCTMCPNREGVYNPSIGANNLALFYNITDTIRAPWIDSLYFCSATCLANYYKESKVCKKTNFDFRFAKQHRYGHLLSEDRYNYLTYQHNKVAAKMWLNRERAERIEKVAENKFNDFLERRYAKGDLKEPAHISQTEFYTQEELQENDLTFQEPEKIPVIMISTGSDWNDL